MKLDRTVAGSETGWWAEARKGSPTRVLTNLGSVQSSMKQDSRKTSESSSGQSALGLRHWADSGEPVSSWLSKKRYGVGEKLILRGRQCVVAKVLEIGGFKNGNYSWIKGGSPLRRGWGQPETQLEDNTLLVSVGKKTLATELAWDRILYLGWQDCYDSLCHSGLDWPLTYLPALTLGTCSPYPT